MTARVGFVYIVYLDITRRQTLIQHQDSGFNLYDKCSCYIIIL